jgi:hypothetical protein
MMKLSKNSGGNVWPAHSPNSVHMSASEHSRPSSHRVPGASNSTAHLPLAGLQNGTRHGPASSSHTRGSPRHLPIAHTLLSVHRSPSSQSSPSNAGTATQAPPGSQRPRMHGSLPRPRQSSSMSQARSAHWPNAQAFDRQSDGCSHI